MARRAQVREEYPGIEVKQVQDSFLMVSKFGNDNEIKTIRQSQVSKVENNPIKSDLPQIEGLHQMDMNRFRINPQISSNFMFLTFQMQHAILKRI